jgi:hypothetical protein
MHTTNDFFVPNFMFSLNNQSSDPHPRKEAFRFRDGMIIVTTPIFSEQDVLECLQKVCHAFELDSPVPSDVLPITLHAPATQSIAHIERLAGLVRAKQMDPHSRQHAEWETKNLNYFDIPVEYESITPYSSDPVSRADPLPTHEQEIVETEHIEEVFEKVVDNRPFRDRLVPSAKMEAARRKHQIIATKKAMHARKLREAAEKAIVPTPESAVLLTRDGKRRPIPMMGERETGGDRDQTEAWRQEVAKELGMSHRQEKQLERRMARMKENEERRKQREQREQKAHAIENAEKLRQITENDIGESGLGNGNGRNDGPIDTGRVARQIEILSREMERAKVGRNVKVSGGNPNLDINGETKIPIEDVRGEGEKQLTQGGKALLDDLKKFSSMKLTAPVPGDLLPILKRGQNKAARA